MISRTKYFSHCFGVFEGGGVRGAALAGAHEAAIAAGVTFGAVAGTSAGSVVAAMIAAGAGPKFINDAMMRKRFADFLIPLERDKEVFTEVHPVLRNVSSLLLGRAREILNVALRAGTYSSLHVQEWMEEQLHSILEIEGSQRVEFRHLPIPLYVVASDIASRGVHLWSRDTTPTDSVAFAVRCSSSIPLFFQAVRADGNAVYVDGGLLSNLPAFVFSQANKDTMRSVLSKVLAFRMRDEDASLPTDRLHNILEFGERMIATTIGGSTSIQLLLQPDVYTVHIDTGQIRATDFKTITDENKETLRRAGYSAVQQFIGEEGLHIRGRRISNYRGFDEKMLLAAEGIRSSQQSVWISGAGTYWIYNLFPTILAAIGRNVVVNVIAKPENHAAEDRASETYRRNLLRDLGANVFEADRPPFDGFLFDFGLDSSVAVLSSGIGKLGIDYGFTDEIVNRYTKALDAPVIQNLGAAVAQFSGASEMQEEIQKARVLPCTDPEELFDRLKAVPQYGNASFSIQTIQPACALVLEKFIKEYKVVKINELAAEFARENKSLFSTQRVHFSRGNSSLMVPPVLEKRGGQLVVIEGITRAYYCWRQDLELECIVADGVDAPLPGKARAISHLRITSKTLTPAENVDDFESQYFRPIEKTVHGG